MLEWAHWVVTVRVGVTRNTVWMWENGLSDPTGPASRLLRFLAREIWTHSQGLT